MTQQELEALKATFPWRTTIERTGVVGGIVKVIDTNGNEVPILAMTSFLEIVTAKMAKRAEQPETQ